MANSVPVPTQIRDIPAGEMTYLFTKSLSTTDVEKHFLFVGEGIHEYLRKKPLEFVPLLTPKRCGLITVKVRDSRDTPRINLAEWAPFVSANGFAVGHCIHCWGYYDGLVLSLVIEKA